MKKAPLLSIYLPIHNHSKIIENNLGIIAKQIRAIGVLDDIEVVISDNASTDGTKEKVQNFINANSDINIIYSCNTENIGGIRNIAHLWNKTSGSYVVMIGDDSFAAGGLVNIYSSIKEHEGYDIIILKNNTYTDFEYIKDASMKDVIRNIDKLQYIGNFVLKRSHFEVDVRACSQTTQDNKELFASPRGSFDTSDFGKFSSDNCISEENCFSSYAQNSLRSEAKTLGTCSSNCDIDFSNAYPHMIMIMDRIFDAKIVVDTRFVAINILISWDFEKTVKIIFKLRIDCFKIIKRVESKLSKQDYQLLIKHQNKILYNNLRYIRGYKNRFSLFKYILNEIPVKKPKIIIALALNCLPSPLFYLFKFIDNGFKYCKYSVQEVKRNRVRWAQKDYLELQDYVGDEFQVKDHE